MIQSTTDTTTSSVQSRLAATANVCQYSTALPDPALSGIAAKGHL